MGKLKAKSEDRFYSWWIGLSHKSRVRISLAFLGLFSSLSFMLPVDNEISGEIGSCAAFEECLGFFFVALFGFFFGFLANSRRKDESEKETLVCSFLYWIFYFIGALYWLVYPLTIDLSLHWVLIPFALLAVPAYLSIPLLLPVYLTQKFCKNVWIASLVFSSSTFFVMYLQGHYAPGFPWALPGYVWGHNPNLMQGLSVWGIYGQTFFTLLMGSIFGVFIVGLKGNSTDNAKELSEIEVLEKFKKSEINFSEELKKADFKKCGLSLTILLVAFSSLSVFGSIRLSGNSMEYTPYKVRCVQGSIHQKDKMNRNLSAHNLNLYLNLSRMKSERDNWSPDFVIWPEASVPYLFTDKSKMLAEKLTNVVPPDGYLLVGAVRKDSVSGDVYNSVIVLDEFGKNVTNYDKKHLVPFGEYIPFRRFIPDVFAPIANSIGDFALGKNSNVINLKGLKIAFTICYEAIFPGEFILSDSNIDVIVNVTNDAWFGHTSEPVQHLNIVRARAIEEGVPLIRVTNFGISAVFDAYGRKVDFLKTDEIGVIDCYIPKKIKKTFFRKFFMDKMKLKQ